MIDPTLYRQPVVLDRGLHRALRLTRDAGEPAAAAQANAVFVPSAEFADASREFPIVFVRAGADPADPAKPEIAPMALFGLAKEENLFWDDARWSAQYVPLYVRRHPFAMARLQDGGPQRLMMIDRAWSGFSETDGERLFDDAGAPTPLLERISRFVEQFDAEVERTRQGCALLRDAGLLRDMRFRATLPDGGTLTVDGFLVVDDDKLNALPDAQVMEMHRNGLLPMIHMHRASLGLMRRLVERRVARGGGTAAAAAAA
jgi:hypothetical protein